MPQLSPLNWILLFTMFWAAVLTTSILLWWSTKVYFSLEASRDLDSKENKWEW